MANLAKAYAQLIQKAEAAGQGASFTAKLLAYMQAKGHLSLLQRVVNIAGRIENTEEAVVYVKSEADLPKLKPRIKESLSLLGTDEKPRIVIDPKIVGGYLARYKGQFVDKSFRSALVNMYYKSVR